MSWISALFYSIFMDAICSLLHPNFSPYLIQYFVEAFTKDCLDNGSVTDKCPIFLFAINLASFFIFPFTKKDNGVVKNASPAPIANVEQNSYLFCLQNKCIMSNATLFCSGSIKPQLIKIWTFGFGSIWYVSNVFKKFNKVEGIPSAYKGSDHMLLSGDKSVCVNQASW